MTRRPLWRCRAAAILIGALLLMPFAGSGRGSAQVEPLTVTPTTTTAPAPSVPSDADPAEGEEDGVSFEETDDGGGGGGGNNRVTVRNHTDGRLRIRGNIQLNRIRGPNVSPGNIALAYNDACTDCQSIAVALQLNLISRTAEQITPENYGLALNVGRAAAADRPEQRCVRCVAVARAIHYVYSVDDPSETPDEVKELMKALDRELKDIYKDKDIELGDAETRINAVIARFRTLPQIINEDRDEDTADGAPGAASPTPTP